MTSENNKLLAPKKRGRPKKETGRFRTVSVRFDESEVQNLSQVSAKNKFKTVSAFCRTVLLAAVNSKEPMGSMDEIKPELRGLIYEVNSVGVNLNQLARGMNDGKIVQNNELRDILSAVQDSNNKLRTTLVEKLKSINT